MKRLFILIFMIGVSAIEAQVVNPSKTFKVPLKTVDEKIEIEVDNTNKKISLKSDKTYAWFKSKEVHSTQGGYSGKLLHGDYIAYYKSNQLKTKGKYHYGLKDGEWVLWKENGEKQETTYWSKGVLKKEEDNNGKKDEEQKKEEPLNQEKEKKTSSEYLKIDGDIQKEEHPLDNSSTEKPVKKKKVKKEKTKKQKKQKEIETDKNEIKS